MAECGNPGGDGNASESGTPGPLLYFQPSASVAAGATTINLTSTAGLAADDMVLVIQMQGADINSNDSSRYGDGALGDPGSGYLNNGNFTAGRYEYAVVASVGGGSITLTQPLNFAYFQQNFGSQGQRRYQVVRVPQYSNLTLAGDITAPAWNGTTGGVLAMDVAGDLDFNGYTIDMAGRGFRGGGGRRLTGEGGGTDTDYRSFSWQDYHGSKGEGIAGTPRYVHNRFTDTVVNTGSEGYPNGSYARGAPGNAGGGGTDGRPNNNDENSGGGGGGNGGAGAKGGNTWNSNEPVGGFGGVAFPASVDRIVMGGGGGAASRNNSTGADSSGGTGGGIVMLRVGRVTGSGTIDVDGSDGDTPENDGGGGGGAGGSIILLADDQQGTLTLNARGGNGGNAHVGGDTHGPGGGGGGGAIFTTAAITASVDAGQGASGYTVTPGNYYGATPSGGVVGNEVPNSDPDDVSGADSGYECAPPQLTILKTANQANADPGQEVTYSITVTNTGLGKAYNVELTDNLGRYVDFVADAYGAGTHFEFTDSVSDPSGASIANQLYSEDGGSSFQPIPGPAGWEQRMTHWRLEMNGPMNRDGQFTIRYRQQVE